MKPAPPPESKPQSLALGAVFFISGAVALTYEAAWQRQFTLLFGSAAPATAAVLAAYFAGLGLGSWLLGKWGARWSRPLRTYAALELVIAAGAMLVTPLLSLYARFYPDLFSLGQNHPALLTISKGLLAFLAIMIPSAAMGGTLPVLAQLFENRRDRLGDLAGRLYMLNTAGAALGVLLFPLLLKMLGLRAGIWCCAALNLLLALVALRLANATATATAPCATPDNVQPNAPGLRRWLALACISGFITFVLQISWSRLFAQTHGNSVYSFSLIVAIFIAAIAAGTQLARVLLRRKWTPEKALSSMWMTGGSLTLVCAALFPAFTGGLQYAETAAVFPWSLFGLSVLVIFIPVLFLAAGLPLILQKAATLTSRAAGSLTGEVFAWNVSGSVAGALAAGFVFPLTLGLWSTVFFAATIALICAALVAPKKSPYRLLFIGAGAAAVATGLFDLWPRVRIDAAHGEKLLALREGPYGVVAVVEVPGSRKLKLNNHYGLGGSASAGDERMQAHIPLLMSAGGRQSRSLFLGYGTGISAGGALFHDSAGDFAVTALELVPEAAALAGEFFAAANNSFATHPRTRLIHEDARNYLRGTNREFDAIIGDLVVPWRQGEGALYTLEHFQAARARLAPGGLYCAWLPLYQLGEDDFRCILRTFLEVFPAAAVWRPDFSPDQPALGLIGFAGTDFDPGVLARRHQQAGLLMKPDPLNPHLAYPASLWMHYIGTITRDQALRVELNTEDNPRVELRTSRPLPFTGRRFQSWEYEVRRASPGKDLPPEVQAGREAGRLMGEFSLLFSEHREVEAAAVQKKIVETLGPAAARSVFGE